MAVEIDLASFGLTPDGRKARMRRIGDGIVAEWTAVAKEKLGRRSRGSYVKSIGIRSLSEDTVTVSLPGPGQESTAMLALIVELGFGGGGLGTEGSYDVRQHLLKYSSKNVRFGKNGPYMNVPFDRAGAAIQELGGSGARAAATALIGSFTGSSRPGPEGSGRMVAGMAPKISPHHVADPLQGMIKLVSTYASGKIQTTGWRIWRRASWNGQAWMSKGVKARNLAGIVEKKLPEIVSEAL
jgi:hypothetical protein